MKRYTGRKIQRTICGVAAAVAFLVTLGICGGIEQGLVSLKLGTILMVGGVFCFAVLLWGAGALEGNL